IAVTLLHAGGDANHHPAVFAAYARSGIWTAVHAGQFASMAILLAGLLALFFAIDGHQTETSRWAGRFGAASAVAALALYGVLQAVEGVAPKEAGNRTARPAGGGKALRVERAEGLRRLQGGARRS